MNQASEKYVIGLTGNIGTGKTVVRRMLEQLGAFTIDADGLSHRAIARGAPGYEPVVLAFGTGVLNANGEIDRTKLGAAVFHDPSGLKKLEAIVHPLVRQAVDVLMQRASQPIIVIDAIKLLEGNLPKLCDSIWVTDATPALQLERLMTTRSMSREQALLRINGQGSQADKIAAANVVIRNLGSPDDLWGEVSKAWMEHVPVGVRSDAYAEEERISGELGVTRGRPEDSEMIAGLINRLDPRGRKFTTADVMAQFGKTTYMLLHVEKEAVAMATWKAENLVACTTDLRFAPTIDIEKAVGGLIQGIERISVGLQCDASLLFLAADQAANESLWNRLGYEQRTPAALDMQAWRDAASASKRGDAMLFLKQVATDPIFGRIGAGTAQFTGQRKNARSAAGS